MGVVSAVFPKLLQHGNADARSARNGGIISFCNLSKLNLDIPTCPRVHPIEIHVCT